MRLDEMRLSRHPEVAQHEQARDAYLALMHADDPAAEMAGMRQKADQLRWQAKTERVLVSPWTAPPMTVRFPVSSRTARYRLLASGAPPWRCVYCGSDLPDDTPKTLSVQMPDPLASVYLTSSEATRDDWLRAQAAEEAGGTVTIRVSCADPDECMDRVDRLQGRAGPAHVPAEAELESMTMALSAFLDDLDAAALAAAQPLADPVVALSAAPRPVVALPAAPRPVPAPPAPRPAPVPARQARRRAHPAQRRRRDPFRAYQNR